MIELIFAIFLISEKLVFLDEPIPSSLCLELNVLASHVDERKLMSEVEKRWRGNEPRLEAFHTFWENRDICTISDRP